MSSMHSRKSIESGGMTRRDAAKVVSVSQPRVSDLMRGRIERFSIDALVDLLCRLGRHVGFAGVLPDKDSMHGKRRGDKLSTQRRAVLRTVRPNRLLARMVFVLMHLGHRDILFGSMRNAA